MLLLAGLLVACQQAPPPPSPAPSPQNGYGATERAFVELAIATDEQALKLLDLTDSAELKENRNIELTELRKLLDAPYVNNHAGHDMPGMPTDAEIQLASTNPDALKQFVRTHLTESLEVLRSAGLAITHPPTAEVVELMQRHRTAELAAG
ncbi:hypothetical protein [Lentzea flaviverrucosa]|uniref:DUF305 domain-containing protein n=1 Tax=Lentzea flaviverrucosa TaxID=200379 RepID=A0A1H9KGR5_9PSEU|nr:hypothetical protein [Lentzea flaviverrucosa]RDI17870.1 hypothetical protein DFR72_12094 [Lentzea flaviverrucosa]SEQ98288.1 hypothetical protein SAMN05216195_103593 [Lentzea flaviverrucosa]